MESVMAATWIQCFGCSRADPIGPLLLTAQVGPNFKKTQTVLSRKTNVSHGSSERDACFTDPLHWFESRLFLPDTNGRFPVGVTTFATPVRPARAIGSVKLKNVQSKDKPKNALYLEEVAFTAYYPADINANSRKGAPWLLRYATIRILYLQIADWGM